MVIVGRGEEGLQRRQRSSLDRHNSPNSPECAAAADGSTTDAADSNATAATAEAEAQSTAHTEAALIRRDLLGNFTEEPVRPLWPSLVQAASTAYDYILPLSAVPTAKSTAADITASACRREERLRHTQQLPPSPPLKLQWQENRKPLLGQAATPAAAVPAQAVPREPRATHQHRPRLPLPLRLSRPRRLRRQQRHRRRGRAANSNKKWKKVAANNSLTFDFFNYLAFGPWPLEKGTSDLAEKAEARQEGWPGGGSAGRGAGPAAGRGPRLTLQPLAAVLLVAKYYQ